MPRMSVCSAVIGAALLLCMQIIPAHAQATRTWVSGVGDDANPCSRTAPCKTFAGAISKTAASGEIDCLDPGGFGALTITKAITILCTPVSNGGVLVAGTNGITVAAGATDHVVLDGLDFEGLQPTSGPGLTGVSVTSGLEVDILNCKIRNFKQNGVNVASSTANAHVTVHNCYIENNGVSGTANTGGVNVQSGSVTNVLSVYNSILDANANYAVQANGSNSIAVIANDVLENGLSIVSGGSVRSYGVPVSGAPANAGGSSVIGGSTNPTSHVPFN
jgi:hypothetical protein